MQPRVEKISALGWKCGDRLAVVERQRGDDGGWVLSLKVRQGGGVWAVLKQVWYASRRTACQDARKLVQK
jgi:hypothetical protein